MFNKYIVLIVNYAYILYMYYMHFIKMGTMKDRSGMGLIEAEDIKKRDT